MHRKAHATLTMLTENGQTGFLARYVNAPFPFLVDVDLTLFGNSLGGVRGMSTWQQWCKSWVTTMSES